ncbi:putative S-adenosylmethionine-dependent methyltransferase/MSMEI_2290 [Fundidesulfovibrio magnetotacticus]|uniref:Putative S-adenosylmethionine-dependent methyltransferase/MSMEI_2290 n=1 Tax=Fundidesulfovibrio magnetotacticus TaxID=2730080 RepID=A0A6V8LVQ2_9BACT|nr:class I SAM-dependent methyltransferase [Fundidesulfovibrio magnetotacticus]GFK94169.1 putative S-adenosylmethionine-dependent methyltransferase/MSMEI_2290 [Fundidesulfovibrio magnetotacticus]
MKRAVESRFDQRLAAQAKAAYRFDAASLGHKDRAIAAFLRALSLPGKRCLDVGPGTGRWLRFLQAEGAGPLCAADISAEALALAAPLCEKVQKLDLERDVLDFPDASFDLAVSFEVLEHLADPDNYVRELRRVVRPGGSILMSVPNVVSFISRVRVALGGLPPAISQDPTHLRHYRRKDVAALLARHGLAARFIPTSFSLNPLDPKCRVRVPPCALLAGLDDSLLFHAAV